MILGILQARMSSTRLPGKVLKPLCGAPALERQIERLRRAKEIDELLVATSSEPEDQAIAELCAHLGIACFCGDLANVLDRFYRAAADRNPDHMVRLTADCPLADWRVIDDLVRLHLEGGYDYSSNALERSFPVGLDCEAMRFAVLEQAWREADTAYQKEHVTPFIYDADQSFNCGSLKQVTNLSALRWTLDTPQDYALIAKVYEALYPANPRFLTEDILAYLLAHPEVRKLNADREAEAQYRDAAKI